MIETVSLNKTTYNSLPFKFEAGTSNYVGAIALSVAIDFVSEIGILNIEEYENKLLKYATEIFSKIPEIKIYGNAPQKCGLISFLINGLHASDIAMILDKKGIAIRSGTHCAEPVMNFFKITGTARASFAMYNTIEEIDILEEALKIVCKISA